MRSEAEIQAVLSEEIRFRKDPNYPMELHSYAHNAGWIEALQWVLGEEMGTNGGEHNESNK